MSEITHAVSLVWPDGSLTFVPLSEVPGSTVEINGKRVRPMLVLYDDNIRLIETEHERLSLICDLRAVGAYWRV